MKKKKALYNETPKKVSKKTDDVVVYATVSEIRKKKALAAGAGGEACYTGYVQKVTVLAESIFLEEKLKKTVERDEKLRALVDEKEEKV